MWYCTCFFFFKQKTAYEMRISDWSSDVCSSDLLRADTLQADPGFKRRTMTDLHGPLNDDLLQRGDRGEPIYEVRLQLEGLGYIKIGRASCRERVCQYV